MVTPQEFILCSLAHAVSLFQSLGRMLDARQLGLKLIANVTFGYTSAHFSGRMPCVEVSRKEALLVVLTSLFVCLFVCFFI